MKVFIDKETLSRSILLFINDYTPTTEDECLTVKQAIDYLKLREKKINSIKTGLTMEEITNLLNEIE